mgnify:CR=1 FL=1
MSIERSRAPHSAADSTGGLVSGGPVVVQSEHAGSGGDDDGDVAAGDGAVDIQGSQHDLGPD